MQEIGYLLSCMLWLPGPVVHSTLLSCFGHARETTWACEAQYDGGR